MSEKSVAGKSTLKKHEVARPLHIQRLETALDIRPFVNQVENILNSDAESNSDDDDDPKTTENEFYRGDKKMHGVVTTKQERQGDRLRLYNFSSVGAERQWLKNVLLSSGSETSSEDDSPAAKGRRLKRILKERRRHNNYIKEYNKDPGNSRYMYYGAGLLSTVDRYPERRISRPVPQPPSTRGRRGRPSDRGASAGRGTYKARRGRNKDNRIINETHDLVDGVVIDWEEQLRNLKDDKDKDEDDFAILDKPGIRGRKKLAAMKSPEALTARRRRHWQLLVKKELGKMQRARTSTHREVMLQRKRLATLCCKHWRQLAMQSQKNMKETVWRCKRLSREMQAYWRRYDRAERETRRRMEREAEEQRKMDVELMEAKRQRRKLNFLITQTELYAHFMQRKMSEEGDSGADQILRQLDEDRDPRLAAIDHYDSEAMKAQASRNAREAFKAERARTQQFDAAAGVDDAQSESDRRGGDYDQPNIFQGTLKGYQLKGMNWLANLYDQGISGILADEMGLGKTVQCIAFLCHVAERLGVWGPFLVVSPASTLHNWQQEMQRFVPDFKVVPYWGSPAERKILRQFWERKDLHTPHAAFHVVITSYQIVVSDLKYLNRVSWQYMILDEAQAIKSSASMRWKLLLGFSCRNRLLLSGTPIQNSMAELWALLHFIMPTLFDSHEEFNEWFSKDIESHAENKSTIDEKHLSRLHMILKPFMLRRIKKDVENELSDKIEIMVHCPLTIRQKLLYIALKKKIKIEELLHYSVGAESGHNVDKNFTSNLMNLVMQFRKVCNHPELFERRDVRSPFAMQVDDYHIPKIVAEECILIRSIPSKRHLLYNKLSILVPEYIHGSISEEDELSGINVGGFFGFTRFMDLSPTELYRVMLCGWLYAMLHIEQCLEKFDKLRHREFWWKHSRGRPPRRKSAAKKRDSGEYIPPKYYDITNSKNLLFICPDGDVLKSRKDDSLLWKGLLFTDPLWGKGGPFYTHADHILHYIPETVEHRAMRLRHLRERDGQYDLLSEIKTEDGGVTPVPEIVDMLESPHIERSPIVLPDMPTPVPGFLYTTQPKVCAWTREAFAVSRNFAYHQIRHQHGECREGAELLRQLVAAASPAFGWAYVQVPDKNQLVSDAGKLTVLDSLLKRLKEKGHRVLIYSQMTKMIDLLEEYMWHRKHKYMRLDGSSKISARRDMVADFQARADIFVFLLSTRAGGLGINLTAADTVIFYDSDWNPTVDQQAMDRAHRLGQTKQVTVYRLICKGTIEERIMQRAREKSEIQRMVISGGNFKPDTLKPKEVVSLLLDDEEIELKYRQKSEEKKLMEEKERKRKMGILPQQQPAPPTPVEPKKLRDSISEPGSPLDVDDEGELVVDIPSQPATPVSYSPPMRSSSWGATRSGRGSRRGRPRGSRHAMSRRTDAKPADNAVAVAAGAALLESDAPLEAIEPAPSPVPEGRGRRGPGRPRLRTTAPRGPTRRPRRPREPLLVPLAPPP
ncbi:chromatin-remodeling ATPase INO80 isoform X2 [Pectinophora gossypiella]|uniref:chromatin-remodeling ATPase INO80 isoform X2 n=1 Tax=Pectinophora gossypiella TaxID=13191 RepID=UPI00214E4A37|nr:chromatin-remodeling ATPase INO80 isoform X2 [Pectinophora gossypiella]